MPSAREFSRAHSTPSAVAFLGWGRPNNFADVARHAFRTPSRVQTLAEFLAWQIRETDARLQQAIRANNLEAQRVNKLRLDFIERVARELLGDLDDDEGQEDPGAPQSPLQSWAREREGPELFLTTTSKLYGSATSDNLLLNLSGSDFLCLSLVIFASATRRRALPIAKTGSDSFSDHAATSKVGCKAAGTYAMARAFADSPSGRLSSKGHLNDAFIFGGVSSSSVIPRSAMA